VRLLEGLRQRAASCWRSFLMERRLGPHNLTSSGCLLLVTHSCNLDFNDWVAITGVDPHRVADGVIEVATSSSEGELNE